jgi:transcription antitermination factor NusG
LQILDLTKTIHHPPIDSINSWRLYSLTWIDLNLTDEFAKVKLPHLEHLSVKKNSAVSMKGMQGGYIYANLIVCAAFKNLAKRFPRLTYFAASGCHKLSPDLLDELLPFKGLKELHLTRTAITSFSIKQYFQSTYHHTACSLF